MTQIIVDASLPSKLPTLMQAVELLDPTGRVLGQFIPALDLSQYEPLEPQISEEEMRRREQSSERRYTTAEVLAHLEQLSCSASSGSNRRLTI